MNKILAGAFSLSLMAATVMAVHAAPNNPKKAENNPNQVAYYDFGIHAVPTDPISYVEGTDLVMARGNSGQIEAWYTGADGHGYHSVWNIAKDGNYPAGSVFIPNAYPTWGDYLIPAADYYVQVNAF